MKIHHVGFAVYNLENAKKAFMSLGYTVKKERIEDPFRDLEYVFMEKEHMMIELLAPLSASSPVSGWLAKNGASPYHVCYETDDFEDDTNLLRRQGFTVIKNAEPSVALDGRKICFLYSTAIGIVELLEEVKP
ncbi:MAG: VOC family protein [Synergistaceae bacterium]|jgi:methylmalonyl-CoA/ethylmalonyl-CoA epimerase|nr:VOC family protein [Synergistaceae bacterium]